MIKYIVFTFLVVLISCYNDIDLGHYGTLEGDYENKIIFKDVRLSNDTFGIEDIYFKVVDYKLFNQYIIIKQIPNKSSHQNFLDFKLMKYFHFQDTVSKNRFVDSILNNNPHYKEVFSREENFYILEKNKGKMYGPYDYETYLKKKNDLKIPKDVKMDCEK